MFISKTQFNLFLKKMRNLVAMKLIFISYDSFNDKQQGHMRPKKNAMK